MEIQVTIVDREGVAHKVMAPTDMNMTIMELIRAYELAPEGTIGVCGGMAMCASCQCYVTAHEQLPEQSHDERAMLADAFFIQDNSRLGCQIYLKSELDGLTLTIAPEY
jgi:ferredoxin-2, mitochondrial